MKIISLVPVLLLLLPVIACGGQPPPQPATTTTAAPQDPFTWDFGKVKAGKVLAHDFILKNEKGSVLRITDVRTSCGCTVSKVTKKTIAPGESTVIKVQFDSEGYYGPAQQFVYVTTDDLDNQILKYIIKADVVK